MSEALRYTFPDHGYKDRRNVGNSQTTLSTHILVPEPLTIFPHIDFGYVILKES